MSLSFIGVWRRRGGILRHGVGEFAVLAGGGAGWHRGRAGVIVVRRRITDPVLETVAALVTPYAAYLLGETFHVSGVTSVIVADLVIRARRSRITTAQTRLHLRLVYQTVVFALESVIFGLIGLEFPQLVRATGHLGHWLVAALAVTWTLIATRVAWVFPLSALPAAPWHASSGPAGPHRGLMGGTRGGVCRDPFVLADVMDVRGAGAVRLGRAGS